MNQKIKSKDAIPTGSLRDLVVNAGETVRFLGTSAVDSVLGGRNA